ncbi:MAG: tRNA uridine-5-carboxymethylaminomethyl(34) synthesis GTPase MnmE, partial [Cytophagales bacterium]|nr:tRNA uridine-5-carboxymethylaminomethyl(34) synthesis GTPase MnmE [Cytophagales bacterium]
MKTFTDDIIIALATPTGNGAIAVIRIAGKDSIQLVERCTKIIFSRQVTICNFYKNNDLIDDVVVTTYKMGYTCQECVEISCHNSQYIIQNILTELIDQGARMADHGEFTRRAFLNGRFDLLQSEAVADLIASDSKDSHNIALQQMKGNFSQSLKNIRHELIEVASFLELEIDFSQEDVEFVNRNEIFEKIKKIHQQIQEMIQSFEIGDVIKNGLPIAIIGKPNVGKSSLLNFFLNEDRAIVSNIAGTTRDTIEGETFLNGIKCRFIDTAGLKKKTNDEIEILGIQRTYAALEKARLIIYMTAVNSLPQDFSEDLDLLKCKQHILVVNKIDLGEKNFDGDWIYISTKEKKGIDQIENKISQMFKNENYSVVVSNVRHYNELKLISKNLEDAQQSIEEAMPN